MSLLKSLCSLVSSVFYFIQFLSGLELGSEMGRDGEASVARSHFHGIVLPDLMHQNSLHRGDRIYLHTVSSTQLTAEFIRQFQQLRV